MSIRSTLSVIVAATFVGLGGCASKPPSCSDPDTLALVRDLYVKALRENTWQFHDTAAAWKTGEIERNLRIEFPVASGLDEKIKKYSCEAQFVVGEMRLPIEYESQLDDDEKHIVALTSIGRGVDAVSLGQALADAIDRSRTPRAPREKPTASTPQVPTTPMSTPHSQTAETQSATASRPTAAIPTPATTTSLATTPAPTTPASETQSSANIPPSAAPTQASDPLAETTASVRVQAPSFDCAKASTFVETAICNTPILARLDGALGKNYREIRAADIGESARQALKDSQRTWLESRDLCTDVSCIERSYRDRLDEVCEIPVLSGPHPACVVSEEIR